jgi:hypothetical protein
MFEGGADAAALPSLAVALPRLHRAAARRVAGAPSGGGAAEAGGEIASVLWCLAELSGHVHGAEGLHGSGGSSGGGGGGVSGRTSGASSADSATPAHAVEAGTAGSGDDAAALSECLESVGRWMLAVTASGGAARLSAALPGPDGVSCAWGLGRLMGASGSPPAAASDAFDALCAAVAEAIPQSTAGAALAPRAAFCARARADASLQGNDGLLGARAWPARLAPI